MTKNNRGQIKLSGILFEMVQNIQKPSKIEFRGKYSDRSSGIWTVFNVYDDKGNIIHQGYPHKFIEYIEGLGIEDLNIDDIKTPDPVEAEAGTGIDDKTKEALNSKGIEISTRMRDVS